MKKGISFFCFIIMILSVSGCGGMKIRSSDEMYEENPIKEIAIIAVARVEWPRMGGKEAVLGLRESQKALEILLPQTEEEFLKKGYDVTFCKPVAIAYQSPLYKENWVIETPEGNANTENEERKWQTQNLEPAYEYPIVQNNHKFREACRNTFEGIEKAISKREINSFIPAKNDIAIIQQVTGGDTICLNRVYGRKFSDRRKVGTAILSIFSVSSKIPSDNLESHFTCVNASNGEVLWQHGLFLQNDPINPSETFIFKSLEHFPDVNKQMDSKFK